MSVRVVNNLPAFMSRMELKAARAVTSAVVTIAAHASVKTPIDTSLLINSQYRSVTKEGTAIIGEIGYRADYAKYVHDPAVKQTFRRSTAEKEFLRKGGDESKALVDRIVKREMAA